jgi:hypothetical protein
LASVNKVILVGNIGRDPGGRYLRFGASIRQNASDMSASEPSDYLDHCYAIVSRHLLGEHAFVAKASSFTPITLNRSDRGQSKPGRRAPATHSGRVRSSSFFGSSKADKRNAP